MKLKALVVSDHESEYIWDYFDKKAFRGVDVIISCGDLDPSYLSFLVTMIPAPLLYVRGNHDGRYVQRPPEGCTDLEEKPVTVKGVRFLGFGGCKSRQRAANHYSEAAMKKRIRSRLARVILGGGFDVLVTHAPASGLGDGEGMHEGFACFRTLLDRYRPRYHLHGHQHLSYSVNAQRTLSYGETTIINGYNYCIVDMEFPDVKGDRNERKHHRRQRDL